MYNMQKTFEVMYKKYDLKYCETEHNGVEDLLDVRPKSGELSLSPSDFVEAVASAPIEKVRQLYSELIISLGHPDDLAKDSLVDIPNTLIVESFLGELCPLFSVKTDGKFTIWDLLFLKEYLNNS